MLFYKSIVPLNRENHRALHIDTGLTRFAFAAGHHLIPAVTDEFGLGGRALPIVFVPGAGAPQPAFLTGLRAGENLMVNGAGEWTGDYVPAYVRRYPFMMGEVTDAEPLLCIDYTSALLGSVGDPLFAKDGTDGPALESAVRFVADYKLSAERTDAFVAALLRYELFHTVTINVRVSETDTRTLHGLLAVDETRLNTLSTDAFLELRTNGYLPLIYAHLLSLVAVETLRRHLND